MHKLTLITVKNASLSGNKERSRKRDQAPIIYPSLLLDFASHEVLYRLLLNVELLHWNVVLWISDRLARVELWLTKNLVLKHLGLIVLRDGNDCRIELYFHGFPWIDLTPSEDQPVVGFQ